MTKRSLLFAVLALAALVAAACTSATPTSTPASPAAATPPPGTGVSDGVASPPDAQANAGRPAAGVGGTSLMGGLPDIASVVIVVAPSVVSVIATVAQEDLFGRVTRGVSRGSGVIFDDAGYILTNNHVVEDASEVEVRTIDGQRLVVEVIGTDPTTDLAVLKLDPDEVENLVTSPLGSTVETRIGDWVIAIGNPLGFEGSVTVGVISAKGRSLPLGQGVTLFDLIQTDAVINPGNSGGPLLNLRGEVVGINTAIIRGQLASGQEAEGIGFSISMGTAIPVSEQLISNGRVVWPWLGVNVADVNPVMAKEEDLSVDRGVLVVATVEGGPAEAGGVQAGDVIVQVDGTPVTKVTDLQGTLRAEHRIGDTVTIHVVRSAVTLTFEVVLEEMPR